MDFGTTTSENVGVALVFDAQSGHQELIKQTLIFQGSSNPQPLGQAVDLVTGSDFFWAATTYVHEDNNFTYVIGRLMKYFDTTDSHALQTLEHSQTSSTYEGLDVEIVLDDEETPWLVACGADTLHVAKPEEGELFAPAEVLTGLSGGICFVEDVPDATTGELLVNLCDGANCETLRYHPETPVLEDNPVDFWAGASFASANYKDGWLLMTDSVAGAYLYGQSSAHVVLTGEHVLSFDAAFVDNITYLAAIVDTAGTPTILLTYGDLDAGGLTQVTLDLDPSQANLEPAHISVFADDERLFLAVTGTNPSVTGHDAVGWAFFGWP